ncbi:type II secretion system F family protein [Candidatus Woesearchaeota archaeon]|nr:type II secretion system F family protein [Candidatus Woesearchaeota archaeon]
MNDLRFEKLKKILFEEKSQVDQIEKISEQIDSADSSEKQMYDKQLKLLQDNIKKTHEKLKTALSELLFSKPLEIDKKTLPGSDKPQIPKKEEQLEVRDKIASKGGNIYSLKEIAPVGLENETVRRIRIKEKKRKNDLKKESDKSEYSKISSEVFSKTSRKLLGQKNFKSIEEQLIKANLNYTPVGYVSMIIMTTFLSAIIAGFLFLFFLFFNFEATLPIITRALEPINIRFFKVFWILFVIPIFTFIFMFIYPSLERRSAEDAINSELPFATIHMSAISGSMVNPVKIFEIIISTKEYPALQKEFTKMLNEINLYGYDLVSALKNTAKNSPSKKLAELLNGLATTIHSGGDMPKFFDKRAETLLFNYKIEQQKDSKRAETFMDMYISIVIAAPMILMLLMMIMKISGLGVSLSVGGISLLTILGVTVINIIFMTFLHLKKQQ